MFQFTITELAVSRQQGLPFQWHLDAPKAKQNTTKTAGNYEARGWILINGRADEVKLIVRNKEGLISSFPLMEAEQDAIGKSPLSKNSVEYATALGFNIKLPIKGTPVDLGLQFKEENHWIERITLAPQRKLLRGKSDWLFLDNDSNRSLDQYTGKLLISEQTAADWSTYLNLVEKKANAAKITDWCLLLAPAKEELFQDFYPYSRGKTTPFDQITAIAQAFPFVNPIDELRRDRYLTYSPIDTHWTDYGANLAAQAVLRQLKLESHIGSLPSKFSARQITGDLGSKEQPKRSSAVLTLASIVNSKKIFDNAATNHGRIWIYQNDVAPCQGTLVIFGDSFSINLAPQLGEVFKRVVYAHSTALWDDWIIDTESPAYVLLQTNQRFVTQAPGGTDIWAKFRKKTELMSSSNVKALRDSAEDQLASNKKCRPYLQRMLDILPGTAKVKTSPSFNRLESFEINNLAGSANSIAIIGNSPTLLESDYGIDIDSHECIIRINDGRSTGYEKHAGSRTDIRFIGVPLKERYHEFFRNFHEPSLIVTRSSNEEILTSLGWSGDGYFDQRFTLLMQRALKRISTLIPLDNIPEKNPRSGIVILSLLIDAMKSGKTISLYGFETEERDGGAEHFYNDGRTFVGNAANWDEYHCPISYEFYVLKALEGAKLIQINRRNRK